MNAYEILGVPEDATERQIRIAFRRLSLRMHPDRPGGDAQQYKVASAAYALLIDPEDRAAHDAVLRDERHRKANAPPRPADPLAAFVRLAVGIVGVVEAVQRAKREREKGEAPGRETMIAHLARDRCVPMVDLSVAGWIHPIGFTSRGSGAVGTKTSWPHLADGEPPWSADELDGFRAAGAVPRGRSVSMVAMVDRPCEVGPVRLNHEGWTLLAAPAQGPRSPGDWLSVVVRRGPCAPEHPMAVVWTRPT